MNTDHLTGASPAGAPGPRRTLTTSKIIVLIIAALTPLSVVGSTMPLGLAFGGPTTPLMFIVAGCIIGLFCVGYSQMVQRITRPGAFYNYIARGLGRPAGVGAAMIAVVGYPAGLTASFTASAFVAQETLHSLFGITVGWPWLVAVQIGIATLLCYRRIDFNARVVMVVVACEVALIVALVVAIVAAKGLQAFPLSVFTPHAFTIGQWTVAFIFAILCYQGYEAGALYAPEAINPEKTVPRALYGALILLTALLVLISWTLTSVSGVDQQPAVVQDAGIAGFVFGTVQQHLGEVGLWCFSLLIMLAQTACNIAIVNFMSRYINSLAKEQLLPRFLARENRSDSPGTAVLALNGFALIVIFGLAIVGIDPYAQLSAVGFGIGALAATVLQALACASVVAYFLRLPSSQRHWWKTLVAPTLGTALLVIAVVIELRGFTWITGAPMHGLVALLPWAVPIVFTIGVTFGLWLKRNKPDVYATLAAGDTAEEAALLQTRSPRPHRPVNPSGPGTPPRTELEKLP
ncbi:APC family permease [Rhodococcus sp. NPDC057529]|uniref:APC family permease n=1 Tax=Rhodococcus sp. NPDC057529 TaxID=3346158 RepID=UPI003670E832